MNVHLQQSWARGGWEITFYRRGPLGGTVDVMQRDPNNTTGWKWETQSEVAEIGEPSLFLRGDELEALLREAGRVLASTDATIEALADARGVRDRLLALVEKGWEQP